MKTMNNEIMDIERRFGKKQPFRVPDGYFGGLVADVMSRLPEQAPAAKLHVVWWRRRPWVAAAAASVCVAAFSMLFFLHAPADKGPMARHETRPAEVQGDGNASFDMAADYTMIDSDDIYAMVSENQ